MSDEDVAEIDRVVDWEDVALEWAACRRALRARTELSTWECVVLAWLAVNALLGREAA